MSMGERGNATAHAAAANAAVILLKFTAKQR